MDSKIILAILIVALIGIVAATYNGEASDAINTLTSVATEDTPIESVTDSVEASDGSTSENSLIIDESTVKPDKTSSVTTKTNKKTTTNTKNKIPQSTNKQNTVQNITTTTKKTNNQNITNSNTKNDSQPKFKISSTNARTIAINNLPEKFRSANASQPKIMGQYYEVYFTIDNQTIGYYEIDANSGNITGGAFVDEVRP